LATATSYFHIVVESFRPKSTSARHGEIHVRPAPRQVFPQSLFVSCSRRMVTDYPVGTRFRIKAKLVEKDTGAEFLYCYHGWPFDVVK